MPDTLPVSILLTAFMVCAIGAPARAHPWDVGPSDESVARRIAPPPGYHRVAVPPESFTAWLRNLPLRPSGSPVHLHDGSLKRNQRAHHSVLAMDVGARNLQQCADAVMRLRTEYLWAHDRQDEICFRFTSGSRASWSAWANGERPVRGTSGRQWKRSARRDKSYTNLRRYLKRLFIYAGSASLERELEPVTSGAEVAAGDVLIQGGFPGHAVIVLDVTTNDAGEMMMMLAQSYMPAQEIHILRNPETPKSPWYPVRAEGILDTPQWTFHMSDLRRFPERSCQRY